MATEMTQREQLRSLRNDPGLARFVVEGRATGKQLGSGSYGSVEEVTIDSDSGMGIKSKNFTHIFV